MTSARNQGRKKQAAAGWGEQQSLSEELGRLRDREAGGEWEHGHAQPVSQFEGCEELGEGETTHC